MDILTKTLLEITLGGSFWVLALLLCLSVASVAVMLERAWVFFGHLYDEPAFLAVVTPLLRQQRWGAALKLCQESKAFETRVLAAGLQEVTGGRPAVQEAMEAERLRLGLLLERRLGFLGTLGANAPFIGLLGTVLGIIHAFKDLALAEGGGGPAVMAGIAEALVATAVGLLVAIPAVVMYNFYHRRVHLVLERSRVLSHLLLGHLEAGGAAAIQTAPRQAGGRL